MDLSDRLGLKSANPMYDVWRQHTCTFIAETHEMTCSDGAGRVKWRGTVVGVSDVPRRRKLQARRR